MEELDLNYICKWYKFIGRKHKHHEKHGSSITHHHRSCCLEIKREKTKCKNVSLHQNSGLNDGMKIDSPMNVVKLGTILINYVHGERRLNSETTCYHSVQNLPISSRPSSKKLKIEVYKSVIFTCPVKWWLNLLSWQIKKNQLRTKYWW
jgi:hypothetical protein